MTFTTSMVMAVIGLALRLLGPYVFVVNSIPWTLPISAEELAAVQAAQDCPRMAPIDDLTPLIAPYAASELDDWRRTGKGSAPRLMLAKLWTGRDIEAVNAYLCAVTPWSVTGSTWELNQGDYDFTLTILTSMLYFFGDTPDKLYPETVDHMLRVLLVEEGGRRKLKVPRTLGIMFDTENHVLMTESSRYLKNQWLRAHGSDDPAHDNARNGLGDWLEAHLNHLRVEGFHEFNSVPYLQYAVHPIFNLEAFAESPAIAALARSILDNLLWRYALGSLGLRQCAPFRRQPVYIGDLRLNLNRLLPAVEVWTGVNAEEIDQRGLYGFGVIAAMLPYRPPVAITPWLREKPTPYLARIGNGRNAVPEIHSGGPGYLLSAGGVCPDPVSQVIPRPTALLLDDDALDLTKVFCIPGAGPWHAWNNTGVHHRFACGNQPVRAPEGLTPAAQSGNWSVFLPPSPTPIAVAVHNQDDFGLMAIFPEMEASAEELLKELIAVNPDTGRLREHFQWPGEAKNTIEYDPWAPSGEWVITHVNGQATDRRFTHWPLLRMDMVGNTEAFDFCGMSAAD